MSGASAGPVVATAAGSGSAGSASAKIAASGTGSGSAGSHAAPDIILPHGDGTPPKRTTAPLTTAEVSAVSAIDVPGFTREVLSTPTTVEVHYVTQSRPRIQATVLVHPCADACLAMTLGAWRAKGAGLKEYLAPPLRTAADTRFEVSATPLAGAPAIATWQLGQNLPTGSDGNHDGAFSEAYVLYYNDGANEIRVIAEYKDDAMVTKEAMVAAVPQRDLDNVAHAFADVYTHAW